MTIPNAIKPLSCFQTMHHNSPIMQKEPLNSFQKDSSIIYWGIRHKTEANELPDSEVPTPWSWSAQLWGSLSAEISANNYFKRCCTLFTDFLLQACSAFCKAQAYLLSNEFRQTCTVMFEKQRTEPKVYATYSRGLPAGNMPSIVCSVREETADVSRCLRIHWASCLHQGGLLVAWLIVVCVNDDTILCSDGV